MHFRHRVKTWNFTSVPTETPCSIGYAIMGYVWLTTRPEGIIDDESFQPKGVTVNFNSFPNNTLDNPSGALFHWDYQSKLRPNNHISGTLVAYHTPSTHLIRN